MDPFSYAANAAVGATIAAGISQLIKVGNPKAIAVYALGSYAAGQVASKAFQEYQEFAPHYLVNTIVHIGITHFSGKLLAKRICKVDVTAKEVLTIFFAAFEGLAGVGVLDLLSQEIYRRIENHFLSKKELAKVNSSLA